MNGIGRLLLLKFLNSMQEMGYAYSIIGWSSKQQYIFMKNVQCNYD